MFRSLTLGLLAALLLTACASPDGIKPRGSALDATSLDSRVLNNPDSNTPWPNTDWWQQLNDPKLDSLITEALKNSPSMQQAQARLDRANAAVESAKAELKPRVDGNAEISRQRVARIDDPLLQGRRYMTLRQLGLNASYDFDLWGGNRAAWNAALSEAAASTIDHQAARLQLAAQVALAYNALGRAYVLQDIARRDLSRTRHMLELSRQRLKAGLDNDLQLKQNQSLEAGAEAALTAAQQQRYSAAIRLAVLLGRGPDGADSLPHPKLIAPKRIELPASVPAQLAGRRPDLLAARLRTEAAAERIGVSRARFYPNLNLSMTLGTRSILGDAIFGQVSRFGSIAPALNLPIFEGGRLKAGLKRADADYDSAVAHYNDTLLSALGDIADQIYSIKSMRLQIYQQQRARNIADNAYQLAMHSYKAGVSNYLNALSVEQQLLNSEQRLADVRAERIAATIRLFTALGGGFEQRQMPESTVSNDGDAEETASDQTVTAD